MSNEPPRDIVLFLGAGFSSHAGLPVMSGFAAASQTMLDDLARQSHREDRRRFMEAGNVFERFRAYCETANRFVDADAANLESIFCIAESLNEAGQQHLCLGDQEYALNDLIEQIQWWLWKIYHRCYPIDEPDLGDPYEQFVGMLKHHVSRLAILTTNYDLILEYFAWKEGIPCAYPLRRFLRDEAEHVSRDYRDGFGRAQVGSGREEYIGLAPGANSAMLCKLHGSINYFEMAAGEDRMVLRVSRDVAKAPTMIGRSAVQSDRPAIFAMDALWSLRARYGKPIVPAIIPPTYAKLQRRDWLRHLWRHALSALRDASLLIFVGYSMPESDGFMRAMIRGALADRRSNHPLKVFAVDPSEETLTRYRKLFAPLNLTLGKELLQKPFAQSLGFLERILSEAKP